MTVRIGDRHRTTCARGARPLAPTSSCAARCTSGRRSATSSRVTREHVLGRLEGLPLDVTLHETTSGIAALLTGSRPARRSCCAATWTPSRCTRTPASTSRRASTARCTPAATTRTRRCSSRSAKLLAARRGDLAGRVLFMFQPGEEGQHGARFMLDEGLLDVPPLADGTPSPVTGAFALHITSALPSGWLSSRGGSIMASADRLLIRSPARAATPASRTGPSIRSRSPARWCRRCRLMVTRTIDVFDPAVVTIGRITRRDDEQHHPRGRRRSKARSAPSARRPAARSTTGSGGSSTASPRPTGARSTSRSCPATRSRCNDDDVRRLRARRRRRDRRRRQGGAPCRTR